MFRREHRSERRYSVQQPALVRPQGGDGGEVASVTRNISAHGLLLQCETIIPLHSKLEVTVHLPNGLPLKGAGEVLRVEQPSPGAALLVALKCDAPLELLRLD
jgi:PilZ domain